MSRPKPPPACVVCEWVDADHGSMCASCCLEVGPCEVCAPIEAAEAGRALQEGR